MFRDITIGQYLPGDSFIHRLDPRTKILSVLFFMIGIFGVKHLYSYLFILGLTLAVILIAKIPLIYLLKGLKPIFIILIFTVGLHMFLTPGRILLELGPLTITYEGIMKASFMALRLIFLVLFASLLTLTTAPMSLTDGLEKLLTPFAKLGLPAHELAMMMSIALRFIPTLIDETDKIMKAQKARGADFESGNIWQRAKAMIPLLVPLFVSAFRRADELAMAMEARCYRGSEGRTRMKQLVYRKTDLIVTLGMGTAMVAAFFFL
ncbi:energy-coupling factor transporter transmembrane protein EcfT [Clostridia bacterium]|nr:energy-coupling factor transporter transmembrane protein EcfT [Clostridia bacterium]